MVRLNCCLPHKGTNFLANHNIGVVLPITNQLLFTPQRY